MSDTYSKKYNYTRAVLLALSLFLLSNCNKQDLPDNVPRCIKHKINKYDRKAPCFDANVKEFFFQGIFVYVFDPGTCGAEMTIDVYDQDCSYLGSIGDLSGTNEIAGKDFGSAVFQRTIWEN